MGCGLHRERESFGDQPDLLRQRRGSHGELVGLAEVYAEYLLEGQESSLLANKAKPDAWRAVDKLSVAPNSGGKVMTGPTRSTASMQSRSTLAASMLTRHITPDDYLIENTSERE